MSYSVLRDIETCPRRWSLRRADYSGCWNGRGYPGAPAFGTIEGQLVHASLERIVKTAGAVEDARDTKGDGHNASDLASAHKPIHDVIESLRRLGGITPVLSAELATLVTTWKSNPRMRHRVREWEAELQRRLPTLRQRVQTMLSNATVSSTSRNQTTAVSKSADDGPGSGSTKRQPLGAGLFAEVSLNHLELGWYGKADLLGVDVPLRLVESTGETGCTITDFKTGVQKDDHALQLRIYALLWARDRAINPSGRRAKRLTIVYPASVIPVAPPEGEAALTDLESELRSRTNLAKLAIGKSPPEARPSCDACEWCDVKHMCDVFWSGALAGVTSLSTNQNHLCDAEVRVVSKRSPGSWLAKITASPGVDRRVSVGATTLVRARAQDVHVSEILRPGERARLVGAQLLPGEEESKHMTVLTLGRSSEAFAVV